SWAGACWAQAGLPTPPFIALSAAMPEEEVTASVERCIRTYGDQLVVKPIGGTEGKGVVLTSGIVETMHAVHDALHSGEVLVSRECGNVRYLTANGPVRCTVRLNVCWDGGRAIAESGYAQVAGDPGGVASAGCGGRVIALQELWQKLCRIDETTICPTVDDWCKSVTTAENGVTALATELGSTMPALVGVDLLLDADDGGTIQAILLEANGRPAGMGHSRFITPDGPTDEPGVTMHLWQRIRITQKSIEQ
ncbi:MAG TPA: hypothetical protein VHV83_18135, partial [Armatimonadota bacterium]|nr:hypothetical protein [Armatimonadota bacterium]